MATASTKITFSDSVSWIAQEHNITDTSSYAVEDLAWSSANSRGLLEVTGPLSTTPYYTNSDKSNPDITSGGGSKAIALALDGDGEVVTGTYKVKVTLFDNSNTTATSFDASAISGNAITGVTNNFSTGQAVTYDDAGGTTVPELTDDTVYYVSTNSTGSTIKLSTTYANAVAGTDIAMTAGSGTQTLTEVDFERTYQFDLNYVKPTMSLSPSYSVVNPVYLKCVDNTVYDYNGVTPTISRTWVLTYPDNNGTYTSTDATLNTGVFYGSEGGAMNQIKLTSALSYSFDGYYTDATSTNVSWTLTYNLIGQPLNGGILVSTDSDGCDAYCCVKTAYNNYKNAQSNSRKEKFKTIWEESTDLLLMIKQAYDCNDSDQAGVYLSDLQELTSCNGNCGCSDTNTVTQVIGIGTTPNINRLYEYTMASTASTLTISDVFKNYSFADGDFQCFVDGVEITSSTGYSPSFNSSTAVFTFGLSVPINTQVSFYIIKP